jgi:hypothetical protein
LLIHNPYYMRKTEAAHWFWMTGNFDFCAGVDVCAGLGCEYTCEDSEEQMAKVCICRAGYILENAQNCTGNVI